MLKILNSKVFKEIEYCPYCFSKYIDYSFCKNNNSIKAVCRKCKKYIKFVKQIKKTNRN